MPRPIVLVDHEPRLLVEIHSADRFTLKQFITIFDRLHSVWHCGVTSLPWFCGKPHHIILPCGWEGQWSQFAWLLRMVHT